MTEAGRAPLGARGGEEFITIIGPDISTLMEEFRSCSLAARGYAIIGSIGCHRFQLAEGERSSELFGGRHMLAATFRRSGEPVSDAASPDHHLAGNHHA